MQLVGPAAAPQHGAAPREAHAVVEHVAWPCVPPPLRKAPNHLSAACRARQPQRPMGEGQRLRAGAWRAQQARYCSTDDSLTVLKSPDRIFQRERFSVNCDVGDATGGSSCVLRGQFLFQQLYGAEGCHGSRHRPHPHNANKPPLATTPSPTSAPVATPGDLFTGAASRLDQLYGARTLFVFSTRGRVLY